jgi:hypothetical protein
MYVDEVGNADLDASQDPNHRYLSLTGVIVALAHSRDVLGPEFDRLKRKYFVRDPDQRIVFHRKELVNHKYPFDALRDPAICAEFDSELLVVLDRLEFVVVTAVIDKLEHQRRYGTWASHPYHYCLEILLERYVLWLEAAGSRGDVMAEARGKKEDRELSAAFEALTNGTHYIDHARIGQRITSRKLKLETKTDNIAGLQLADLVAHASFRAMKLDREGAPPKQDFGARIASLLVRSKYRRSGWGKIDSYGRKWLP